MRLLLLLVCGMFVFCSCGPRVTDATRGVADKTLKVGIGPEPQDLDPHAVTGVTEAKVLSALFEGLVVEDPSDLSPKPGVAERWEAAASGLEYVFHLRPNARWSNGQPLTAKDFVYSFQRILSRELGSQNAYMLYPMKNAEAFHKGQAAEFAQVGVEAVDERTLRITLSSPTPYFLAMLAHHSFYPVHPPTIEANGGMKARGSRWTRVENFVGNGAFKLVSWEPNRKIRADKSLVYWDAASVKLNAVEFLPIESASSEETAFRGGKLHVTETVPPTKLDSYRKNKADILRVAPYLGTYYYVLNVRKPPMDDKRVRLALSLSLDREAIVRTVTRGGEMSASSFTPDGVGGYSPTPVLRRNLEEARRLVAEAGWPGGKGFPKIEILYNTSENHQKIAQAVQNMWKEGLGIDVELVNQEWKVYLDTRSSFKYDIARMGWIGDYNDPNTFLDLWVTGAGNNHCGWSNTKYDELMRKAALEPAGTGRLELFKQAEGILMDEMPIIPVYVYTSKHLVDPRVKGWCPNILDHHPFKNLSLE